MNDLMTNAMDKFYEMTKKDPVIEINNRKYRVSGYNEVYEPEISRLATHTLQGIIDAIEAEIEPTVKEDLHIHIASPTQVFLETDSFGPFLQRHILIESNAYTSSFHFGKKYKPEEFIIALNAQFVENSARTALLELCGSITKDTSGTIVDTGVSQKMEVKNGISMRDKVEVKNPFSLKPFRTFSEIDQPESDFVFRVHDEGGIYCALYEADGSAWKVKAIETIKTFFKESKIGLPVIA